MRLCNGIKLPQRRRLSGQPLGNTLRLALVTLLSLLSWDGHSKSALAIPPVPLDPTYATPGYATPGYATPGYATPGQQPALPPAEDLPEEILRQEIIVEARSPLNNQPIAPADYAHLQQQLSQTEGDASAVSPDVKSLVFQLKLLNLIKSVLPF
jgi:hypothetical protein